MIGELLSQLGEMLGEMGSGDEAGKDGSEGRNGKHGDDFALSGVKLYKGETLLELTERWRFIYENLYNTETDTFDLSRIPDVHDNVRFDVLHNPHLGLADTLHRMYKLAQNIADCVVPQEYGTTIEEKRSVGVKICHGLLEKIKFDLSVARTDNEVEPMRFMINTDYSQDLPINSMGRRIRTRLYFTSESHLHTVLNVLRFAYDSNDSQPILSNSGIDIVSNTPELCYLTHIVMRVFEDSRPEMQSDPRRFRVEILFSPGATSTPLNINETDRDGDSSRCDTAPLQVIGRDGLSCEELEAFFERAIAAGRTEDYVNQEVESMSTMQESAIQSPKKGKKAKSLKAVSPNILVPLKAENKNASDGMRDLATGTEQKVPDLPMHMPKKLNLDLVTVANTNDAPQSATSITRGSEDDIGEGINNDDDDESDDISRSSFVARKIIYRKVFWTTIAIGSFVIGAGCLVLALRLDSSTRARRWSTTRRYTR
jgi:Histidine phosphatase superfamily (branch 2)